MGVIIGIFLSLRKRIYIMTLAEKLAITIIKLRKEKDLSQETFARIAKLDRRYMSYLENGKRNPSLSYLERIADGLGMSVGELMTEAEKVKTAPKDL